MLTHYWHEPITIGKRRALVDVTIDGFLTVAELGEILTDAVQKSTNERAKVLKSYRMSNLQIHFAPDGDDHGT
jgi:hypothetical protein